MSQCLDVIRSLDSRGRASPLGRPHPVRQVLGLILGLGLKVFVLGFVSHF